MRRGRGRAAGAAPAVAQGRNATNPVAELPKSVVRRAVRQMENYDAGIPSRHGGFVWQARAPSGATGDIVRGGTTGEDE